MSFSDQNVSVVRRRRCCWRKLFTLSSSSPEPLEQGTMHPWVKEIRICSNEGPYPFPRGAKIH